MSKRDVLRFTIIATSAGIVALVLVLAVNGVRWYTVLVLILAALSLVIDLFRWRRRFGGRPAKPS
jgi:uncharacterized membrane protein